mmetsp:Transcript_45463/g.98663  ORF Transcript_45463/g.98663 Transcript_45463/m.98663 type:complete len:975 (-) Transcript_45463:251-3175(-)
MSDDRQAWASAVDPCHSEQEHQALARRDEIKRAGALLRGAKPAPPTGSPSSWRSKNRKQTKQEAKNGNQQSQEEASWVELQEFGDTVFATEEAVHEVLHKLKTRQGFVPYNDVKKLLEYGGPKMQGAKALVQLTVPQGGRMVIVGDTHGQIEDVLWIFFKNGLPSSSNVYLFNGDVVDRGKNSIEIFVLLFMLKLLDPKCVYLNRGNHEDTTMNEHFGFRKECLRKYGVSRGNELYHAFNRMFLGLPLYTVVEAGKDGPRAFVVHAGLPRIPMRLHQLERINHRLEVPPDPSPGMEEILFDCLWSDPRPTPGIGSSTRGAAVVTFGPDVTARFLKDNHLSLLIRSHEVPSDDHGFKWLHNNQCLTVFSASKYGGHGRNFGGVVVVRPSGTPGERFTLKEHWAGTLDALVKLEAETEGAAEQIKNAAAEVCEQRQRKADNIAMLESAEAEVVYHSMRQVVAKRHDLYQYWSAINKSGDMHVDAAVWREGCTTILGESLPLFMLQKTFGVVHPKSGLVCFSRFLERFKVSFHGRPLPTVGWARALAWRVVESLVKANLALPELLKVIDRSGDGCVTFDQFKSLLKECVAWLPSDIAEQFYCMFAGVPTGTKVAGIHLTVHEFLDRLAGFYALTRRIATDQTTQWVPQALPAIRNVILADAAPLARKGASAAERLAVWFTHSDMRNAGLLSCDDFATALSRLSGALAQAKVPSTVGALKAIGTYCDATETGTISFLELLTALTVDQTGKGIDHESALDKGVGFIYLKRESIRSALRAGCDDEGSGVISKSAIVAALGIVSQEKPPPPPQLLRTPSKILPADFQGLARRLFNLIDANKDGTIDQDEFEAVGIEVNDVPLTLQSVCDTDWSGGATFTDFIRFMEVVHEMTGGNALTASVIDQILRLELQQGTRKADLRDEHRGSLFDGVAGMRPDELEAVATMLVGQGDAIEYEAFLDCFAVVDVMDAKLWSPDSEGGW